MFLNLEKIGHCSEKQGVVSSECPLKTGFYVMVCNGSAYLQGGTKKYHDIEAHACGLRNMADHLELKPVLPRLR